MRIYDKSTFWTGVIIFLASTLLSNILIIDLPNENSIKEVPCYDKLGNKVKGLNCEEKIYGISGIERLLYHLLAITIPSVFSLPFILSGLRRRY